MNGIIYPLNWEEIIVYNNVLAGSQSVGTQTLTKELLLRLLETVRLFENKPFCLALSGGIDSSILATLLVMQKIPFTAITIGANDQHPDIVHAKILQKHLRFEHKVLILPENRASSDAYDDLFSSIASFKFKQVICADTVDEMLGGYWKHKKPEAYCERFTPSPLKWTFESLWKELIAGHLRPMNMYAQIFFVKVALPYLGAHDLLRNINISQRVDGNNTKIILRQLAKEIGVPEEIINRPKLGLCSIWETKF